MAHEGDRDDSQRPARAPFADPLAGGLDPTAPGAPHEPGGTDYRQSEGQDAGTPESVPDSDATARRTRPLADADR